MPLNKIVNDFIASSGKSLVGSGGYMRLEDGMIIQWGAGSSSDGYLDPFTYPIVFPNAVMKVIVCEGSAGGWSNPSPQPTIHGVSSPDQYGFLVSSVRIVSGTVAYQTGLSFNWLAIGY